MKNKTNTVSKLRPSESNRCKAHAAHPSLSVFVEGVKKHVKRISTNRGRGTRLRVFVERTGEISLKSDGQESNLRIKAPFGRKKIAVRVVLTAQFFPCLCLKPLGYRLMWHFNFCLVE